MKKFKNRFDASMSQSSNMTNPTPEECLLDLVNRQLKVIYFKNYGGFVWW